MDTDFTWALHRPLTHRRLWMCSAQIEGRELSELGLSLLDSITLRDGAKHTLQHLASAPSEPVPQECRQTQVERPWIWERPFPTNVKHNSLWTCQERGSRFKIHSLSRQPKEGISTRPRLWCLPCGWTVCIQTGKEPGLGLKLEVQDYLTSRSER